MLVILLLCMTSAVYAGEDNGMSVYISALSGGVYEAIDDIYDNGNKSFLINDIVTLHAVRRFVDTAREIEWHVHKQQIPVIMHRMEPEETAYTLHWETLHSRLALLNKIKDSTMGTLYTHAWGQLKVELKAREDALSGRVKECIRNEMRDVHAESSSGTEADTEILDSLTQMLETFKEIALMCENA